MRDLLRLETALPMLAALVACGCRSASAAPSAAPPAPALRPTEVQVCRGFTDKLLAGVTIDPFKGKPDYLELREEPRSFGASPVAATDPWARDAGAGPAPTVLARKGTACAKATDRPACVAALGRIRTGSGFSSRMIGSGMAPKTVVTYLVVNFEDRFEVVTNEEELRRMLAPVDTTNDVELVAGCGRMLKTPSGWEVTKLYTDPGGCFGGTSGWQRFDVSLDGIVTEKEDHTVTRPPTCISGRRPTGLVAGASDGAHGSLAAFFAESAYLEAASVVAFERLADELAARGAPAALVARARRSRDDETRHADVMNGFARGLGGTPRSLEVAEAQPRSLLAMALENAVEGCIRETFGALVAHYQATTAGSREVRDAMRLIAEDETAHASLSWDVAAWLEPRLSESERQELDAARQLALRELAASLLREPSHELRTAAGLPDAREAQQLLAGLALTLAPALARAA
jgi:hypothetical protein